MPYLFRFDVEAITEETVKPVVIAFLRLFALMEVSEAGYSSSKFKTFLFNENFRLVDSSVSEDEIVSDFNSHITKEWERDAIVEDLNEYERHTLVYLNEYLYAVKKGMHFDFLESTNVEHIMPGSGKNKDSIREMAGLTKEEFDLYINKLGNKILLEEDINKSVGNAWFITKLKGCVSEKKGYIGSKFAIALELVNYHKDKWEKEDIDKATEKAVNRIADFILAVEKN